jgi:hypothetical protein
LAKSKQQDSVLKNENPFVTFKGLVWIYDDEELNETKLHYIPFTEVSQWLRPEFLSSFKR